MNPKALLGGLVLCSGTTLMQPAWAHEYVCKNGSATRTISVQHEVDGQEVPCVVRYDKPDQGTTEFPWSARQQLGYCAEKADYLASRLGTFGWDCARTDDEG